MAQIKTGGWTLPKKADASIQEMIAKFKERAEQEKNTTFETFNAVSYETQVVNGTNYSVKIDIGNGQFIWMKLYKPLQGDAEFVAIEEEFPRNE